MAYFVVVAILDRRGDKVACRVARVERREAQRLSPQARAALARLRGGPDRKGSAKGRLANALAPPAAPPLSHLVRENGVLQSSDALICAARAMSAVCDTKTRLCRKSSVVACA